MAISDIIETSMLLQDIFKYEFLVLQDSKLDEQNIKKFIQIAEDKSLIKADYDKGTVTIIQSP